MQLATVAPNPDGPLPGARAAALRVFSPDEDDVWRMLHARLARCRVSQAHPLFVAGLERLGIDGHRTPELGAVNTRLSALTGWRGVPVVGLEDGRSFFAMLARREFPVGNFIRDAADLGYTPAPDIFHDLYGHMPFLADPDYADFCYRFGQSASTLADSPSKLLEYERLFWFGVEFPVIATPSGRRIFGGGILSSSGESDYALSDAPEVLPFDLERIRSQPYRIDIMQTRLFELDRPETLYTCLDAFERRLGAARC